MSISFECGDFVVVWKKFWNDTYVFEVELLQHFLQLRKLSRASRKPFLVRLLCRAALEWAQRIEVNDDEHSRFVALRIGYCYVCMGVGRGRPWILKFSAKKVVFLVLSGKNQISPLLALLEKLRKNHLVGPWKKFFRRPCTYNVWNKSSEAIFEIARDKWGTQYVIGVWSSNFTGAFIVSIIVTGFVSDIAGIQNKAICVWIGTTSSVNVTSTCSGNLYDISCNASRRAPNLK